MKLMAWAVCGAGLFCLCLPGAAEACGGGGVVSTTPGSVGASSQRVLLSIENPDGTGGGPPTTDVVVQIGVPQTTDDYGALLPLPSEPTIDTTPFAAEDLDALDSATAPQISVESGSDSGGGCGCIAVGAAGDDDSAIMGPGARVSAPVNVGPVTATVLSGTTDAVNGWLDDNGFAISDEARATISDYSGYYFIAIKRNSASAPGGPTSIGLHFTMNDDHRELPLRFASIGAAPTVAFTVFLAINLQVGPSEPFAPLTLNDLDGRILRSSGYATAVRSAVHAHGDRAFVIESRTPTSVLSTTPLYPLIKNVSTVTRMSTILPSSALTEDAHFDTPFEGDVPSQRWALGDSAVEMRYASMASLGAPLLLFGWRRRRPPTR